FRSQRFKADVDEDNAISYKVLRRGTPIISADGVQLGTVRRVQEAKRENIFDGIVIQTSDGQRFVDAPEVARIAERAVTVTFPAAEAEQYLGTVSSRLVGRRCRPKPARAEERVVQRPPSA